jgi:CBS domain-containing protein
MQTVEDVMTRNVQVVSPTTSIVEVAQMMRDMDVGSIPVVNGQELVGIVTDRDLTIRCLAEGHDPNGCEVEHAMSKEIATCPADADIEDAARRMRERKIRRMLVTDDKNQLVGIVSLGDLAVRGADEVEAEQTLEEVSEPSHSQA